MFDYQTLGQIWKILYQLIRKKIHRKQLCKEENEKNNINK